MRGNDQVYRSVGLKARALSERSESKGSSL